MSEPSIPNAFEQAEVLSQQLINKPNSNFRKFIGRSALALSLMIGAGSIGAVGEGIVKADVAEAVTDDYPDKDAYDCSATYGKSAWCKDGKPNSSRGYWYRNCTDWTAWRIPQITGVRVPAGLGSADTWDNRALSLAGAEVDNSPEVGDAAVWDSQHVAVVESVNSDGSVNISEYNRSYLGKFGTRSGMRADHYIDFTPSVNEGAASNKSKVASRSDFNGNGNGDILLYKPGGADYVWQGHDAIGDFGEHRIYLGEDYQIAVGDFNGNGRADFLAYANGKLSDYIYYGQSEPGEFKKVLTQIDGYYEQVVPGDFDGDGRDDVMLYDNEGTDKVFYGTTSAGVFDKRDLNIPVGSGNKITAGKYNNNNNGDLFLYNENGTDYVLSGQDRRGSYAFTKHAVIPQLNTVYKRPVSGDFDGDGHDDVLLYGEGDIQDRVLYGRDVSGEFSASNLNIGGNYTPLATGDYNGDGRTDAYLQSPLGDNNKLLSGTRSRGEFIVFTKAPGATYKPIST